MVAVENGDRDAVNFGLDGELGAGGDIFLQLIEPIREASGSGVRNVLGRCREEAQAVAVIGSHDFGFLELVHVLDGEHRDEMVDLGKVGQGSAANPFGGGIGVVEVGMGLFEVFQLVKELIVGSIRDFGGRFVVIEAIVVVELFAKGGDTFGRGHGGGFGIKKRAEDRTFGDRE